MRTTETAKATAMDRRVEDDDFVGIESDADPVAGLHQLDEAIAGLEDVNDDVQGLLKAYGFTENSVYFSLSLKCMSQYLTILTVI